MANYGVTAWDANGEVTFDSVLLTHRMWHSQTVTAGGNYYYAQPLDHEPTLVAVGLNGLDPAWVSHIRSGNQWVGFQVNYNYEFVDPQTLVMAFARGGADPIPGQYGFLVRNPDGQVLIDGRRKNPLLLDERTVQLSLSGYAEIPFSPTPKPVFVTTHSNISVAVVGLKRDNNGNFDRAAIYKEQKPGFVTIRVYEV